MSREELLRIKEIITGKYDSLFNGHGNFRDYKAKRLERIYYLIDHRIGENLKLWR
jgi:hypothetical protein